MRRTIMAACLLLAASPVAAQEFHREFDEFTERCQFADRHNPGVFDACMATAEREVAAIVDRLAFITPNVARSCAQRSRQVFDQVECIITTHTRLEETWNR